MNKGKQMKATFNARQSWEKQSVYNLENNWIAIVGYSHYGQMICRLDCPTGIVLAHGKPYWHCSDGLAELPDFAKPWIEEISNQHGIIAKLVRPMWTAVYHKA